MSNSITFIYALLDPRDEAVRYVGKTKRALPVRLSAHLNDCRKARHRRARWLRELVAEGLKPRMILLEEVAASAWEEAERRWIAHFKDEGADLTNSNNGGGGISGHTAESIAKMKEALKGRPPSRGMLGKKASPETIEKRRAKLLANHPMRGKTYSAAKRARMGRPKGSRSRSKGKPVTPEVRARLIELASHISPEQRAKMVASQRRTINTPEYRERISAIRKGRTASPDTRAKMSRAHTGKAHTSEAKAKISAAHKGRVHSAKSRANMSTAHKGHKQSAETCTKKSAASKAAWARRKAAEAPPSQLPLDL
jgi:hypothetical protein